MSVVLEARDVAVHFGGTKAVDGLTLALEQGVLYGLVGPNGSGKSTLLGAVSRLTGMTRGELFFRGVDYARASPQETARLGLRRTFQTVRLLPGLTVLENVALGADAGLAGQSLLRTWLDVRRSGRVEAAARSAARGAMARMGLTDLADARPTALSYGTQRRVEIARALAAEPQLLLLDEPTAGMTRHERDQIGDILGDLRSDGLTLVLVEHDVPLITRVCDHLFVMNMGQLIASGEPGSVVQQQVVREAYLGRSHRDVA